MGSQLCFRGSVFSFWDVALSLCLHFSRKTLQKGLLEVRWALHLKYLYKIVPSSFLWEMIELCHILVFGFSSASLSLYIFLLLFFCSFTFLLFVFEVLVRCGARRATPHLTLPFFGFLVSWFVFVLILECFGWGGSGRDSSHLTLPSWFYLFWCV